MQQTDNQSTDTHFSGGFANPPVDAAHAFRAAMNAMARPGEVFDITGACAPAGISDAAASLLLTLCDPETKLYLAQDVDSAALRSWVTFHTGAPLVAAQDADFALGSWDALMPLDQYRIGTAEYPDRSATLIVELAEFSAPNARLKGPGIKDSVQMMLPDVPALARNSVLYPQGVDFFFTAGAQVMGLPRSSQITAEG
ncbi:phosphonate C-P lyase system protein PhnH [Epibacterium sp. SM1969]|uniref:Phosphonate C-P lyase system protein PhnH n=1 Tax=Tritonibacter aquimaris TaxID=2663379 RepID=A0A844AP02_9RHOB|nr:phosphonate C-P lyase system protein PhnH [Tritonibacter aquimaris]MQY42293.1 phosphonate C-P lyase system protein PhnH [Tritonibacter aquimaris]